MVAASATSYTHITTQMEHSTYPPRGNRNNPSLSNPKDFLIKHLEFLKQEKIKLLKSRQSMLDISYEFENKLRQEIDKLKRECGIPTDTDGSTKDQDPKRTQFGQGSSSPQASPLGAVGSLTTPTGDMISGRKLFNDDGSENTSARFGTRSGLNKPIQDPHSPDYDQGLTPTQGAPGRSNEPWSPQYGQGQTPTQGVPGRPNEPWSPQYNQGQTPPQGGPGRTNEPWSPQYNQGQTPPQDSPGRTNELVSPQYGQDQTSTQGVPGRPNEPWSPQYNQGQTPLQGAPGRTNEPGSPQYGQGQTPTQGASGRPNEPWSMQYGQGQTPIQGVPGITNEPGLPQYGQGQTPTQGSPGRPTEPWSTQYGQGPIPTQVVPGRPTNTQWPMGVGMEPRRCLSSTDGTEVIATLAKLTTLTKSNQGAPNEVEDVVGKFNQLQEKAVQETKAIKSQRDVMSESQAAVRGRTPPLPRKNTNGSNNS